MVDEKNLVSWNIAASQSQYVFELIKKSMNFYQNGNLSRWYWTLNCLSEMVNHSLETTKREELDEKENEVQNNLKYWIKYRQMVDGHDEFKMTEKEITKKNECSVSIKKYQRDIMDILHSLGYFPSKESGARLNF